jgi:hypothetical protein
VSGDDLEAQSLTFKWEVDGSTVGTDIASFKYEPDFGDAGDHQVTVEVSDGQLSVIHSFHVTVLKGNRSPTVKITTPAAGATYDEGASVSLTAGVSDPDDPNLLRVEYTWSLDGTPVSNEPTFTIKPTPGSHTVTLKVSDGEFSPEDTVTFSVKAKAKSALPGFEIGPLLVAFVVALTLLAWRQKK